MNITQAEAAERMTARRAKLGEDLRALDRALALGHFDAATEAAFDIHRRLVGMQHLADVEGRLYPRPVDAYTPWSMPVYLATELEHIQRLFPNTIRLALYEDIREAMMRGVGDVQAGDLVRLHARLVETRIKFFDPGAPLEDEALAERIQELIDLIDMRRDKREDVPWAIKI